MEEKQRLEISEYHEIRKVLMQDMIWQNPGCIGYFDSGNDQYKTGMKQMLSPYAGSYLRFSPIRIDVAGRSPYALHTGFFDKTSILYRGDLPQAVKSICC